MYSHRCFSLAECLVRVDRACACARFGDVRLLFYTGPMESALV